MRTLADAAGLMRRSAVAGDGLADADILRLVEWGRDVLDALVRLHDRGRFHGEVSPESIRIGAGGAKLAPPEEAPAMLEYRDPERSRYLMREPGGRRAGLPACDVYGVGASLYSALEGGPPPCGSASAFTRPVPEVVAYAVYRALADGAGRYPSAASMREDLARLLRLARSRDLDDVRPSELPSWSGGTVRAPEPLTAWRPKERSRRREIAIRTAVLLLLVAGGIATVLRAHAGGAAASSPSAATAASAEVDRAPLSTLLADWRMRLDASLQAVGERFDPVAIPLVVVSDGPLPADRGGFRVHPSMSLAARVRSVLREGVTADDVRRSLLAAVGRDTLPAVLWLTPAGPDAVRARLYYGGIAYEAVRSRK